MNRDPNQKQQASEAREWDTGHFLKNAQDNAAKTKSNFIEIPSITLPTGGGAIKSIDEKFEVNAVNGTASFSIPLPFSPTRGASPSLNLSYNSGAGNGIFGLGWSLGLSTIKRKTDKELPRYLDMVDSDSYLFSDAEDLVPEFKKDKDVNGNMVFVVDAHGDYVINERDLPDHSFKIRCYRPRIEGLFARIERWLEKETGVIQWRVISKENITTLYGWSDQSRLVDPGDSKRNFEWFPEFVFDDKGNCAQYIYKKEDDKGFDHLLLHNRNRFKDSKITYTNVYLEKVLYGNKTPYKKFGDVYPSENDYLFSTVFDYGEYNAGSPFNLTADWEFRHDAFSDYKSGFEIRTTRLCKRVLLFHHFKGEGEYDGLVRSLNFEYDTATEEDFTFLKSITSCGYIKKPDGSYSSKNLPSLEFEYQKHDWNDSIKNISPENLVHAPVGLDESTYHFTDLFNEGLSGILTEQSGGWYYKHNLGDGKFEQARLVTPKPSFTGLGDQLQLADLDADGGKQLVSYNSQPKGYFELNDENEWQQFTPFEMLVNIDFSDPNIRMIDLNGDGRPEVVVTENDVLTWYESAGRKGFAQMYQVPKPFDEEAGPHVVFADLTESIFLADMSGDTMVDIVRIRNGQVCYWPNLGYGKFGAKVCLDHSPVFDHPDAFDPSYLRLADIDGSGTADIIYLGKNKFTCWMNLSGNAFSTIPFEINGFPEIHNYSKITVTDLLGNGVACIVWSSPLSKDSQTPLKYIDLMNSKKPHIMVSYKNSLGKEVSLYYTPSTKFYIDDKQADRPWVTKLHFPVQCISQTETRDRISGSLFVSTYKYHHGYYDHAEKEFRGFGMVESKDAEHFDHWIKGNSSNIIDKTLHQEPVVTKSWFHTGAFLNRERILEQFAHEYWYEEMAKEGFVASHHEMPLPDARLIAAPGLDASVIDHLSAEEWREALRACKGMSLRSEIFAHDAPLSDPTTDQIKKQLTPYSVATHNCVIELLQPKGQNKYAVFIVKESEAITYNYERNTEEPRIAHTLNIKLDELGNILESASVVYPRMNADLSLPVETREAQDQKLITYTQNNFTNDIDTHDTYRLRLHSETKTYELKGVSKTDSLYSIKEFETVLTTANEVQYHQIDANPPTGVAQKRLIEHIRTLYRNNNLKDALQLHQLDSLALSFESYQLAYTPALLLDIFETKVNTALMDEGKFTHSEGDANWWIRSGKTQFIEDTETEIDAQNRFYVPISFTDPYGALTSVKYSNYFLFIQETEDALGNKASVENFNLRTLSPGRMKDPNNNISEVITDELGFVKAMAVFGKGNEADELSGLNEFSTSAEDVLVNDFFNATASDVLVTHGKNLLQRATARFVYDFNAYKNSGKPLVVSSVAREEHFHKNADSPIQISFEYVNGLGQVVMKKAQAEPGKAKQAVVNSDNSYTISDIDTALMNPKQLRWIGNGRTVLNNKGNPVKQYDPYFSVTHQYEDLKELVETGVTPVIYYDAPGRLIKTEMPDGTFSKTAFNSWQQSVFDANDSILESAWYHNRINHLIDAALIAEGKDPAKEKAAADKSAKHANTPNVQHFDILARAVLSIDHNKNIHTDADEFYHTKVSLDIEGNLRSVTDARGNVMMQFKYDMLGNKVYQTSMDAGQRWLFLNILGNPLRTWDERNHEFQYFFDILHRPVESVVIGGDGELPLNNVFDRIFYGESEANAELKNLRGQVIKHYDTGGLVETPEYDFKGQAISTTRRLFKNYKAVANWADANLESDLEPETFTFITETDALGRITRQTAPDGSIITPSYSEAGLLTRETVEHFEPDITTTYIKDIDYNEKGQRNKIVYGNDVVTEFNYDKDTFRLTSLITKRANNSLLQNLHYTYDGIGNITNIQDNAIATIFYNNMKIEPANEYTYDALNRLVQATGRENDTSLTFHSCDNWNDKSFKHELNPGDPMNARIYTQAYQYDSVGNIVQMKHSAGSSGSWTRNYEYETANNRLRNTSVGQGANSFNYTYDHHPQHGFMTTMSHLEKMGWNFKEEIVITSRQHCIDDSIPVITYYQYDANGLRIRKMTENQAGSGNSPTIKEERIYISGFELYKKHSGADEGLQRVSMSLMDKQNRFVIIESRNDLDDGTEKHLIRYQLHNHLGSANLELDDEARVISYEEYHPYGTTAFQAKNASIKCAAKRYRYTGMERDEETGLNYHRARYYACWLARWTAPDPARTADGMNVFQYARNNSIKLTDPSGKKGIDPKLQQAAVEYKALKKSYTEHREALVAAEQAFTARAEELEKAPPLDASGKPILYGGYPLSWKAEDEAKKYHAAIESLDKQWEQIQATYHAFAYPQGSIRPGTGMDNGLTPEQKFAQFNAAANALKGTVLTALVVAAYGVYTEIRNQSTGPMTPEQLATMYKVVAFGSGLESVGIGVASGIAAFRAAKIRPVGGVVNVGGTGERAGVSNLNPIVHGTGGKTRGIPNWIKRPGEEIGQIFQKGSVRELISSKLTFGTVNWEKLAEGAHKVMAPGGKVVMNVWVSGFEDPNVMVRAFQNAGFKNVRVVGEGVGTTLLATR